MDLLMMLERMSKAQSEYTELLKPCCPWRNSTHPKALMIQHRQTGHSLSTIIMAMCKGRSMLHNCIEVS